MIEKREVIIGREDRITKFPKEFTLSDIIRMTELEFRDEYHYPIYASISVNEKVVAEFGHQI